MTQKFMKNISYMIHPFPWHIIYSHCARGQPRLKSWGGPRFGSQHRDACASRPVKSRVGVGCGRGGPLPLSGSGGITPEKFLKTQMLNPVFWWLLAVKFLAFWKLRPRSWGTNTLLVPQVKVGDQFAQVPIRLLRLWPCADYSIAVNTNN